jgi:hypothetical protein
MLNPWSSRPLLYGGYRRALTGACRPARTGALPGHREDKEDYSERGRPSANPGKHAYHSLAGAH